MGYNSKNFTGLRGLRDMTELTPRLYGLYHSNRQDNDLWGKNQFNSSFPVSLACFMKDKGINAVYLKVDEDLRVRTDEISINEVFNSNLGNENLFFAFESKFDPYQQYIYGELDKIDLVVKKIDGEFLRPLEIKLTVLPDNSTCELEQSEWGCEIVVRPPTLIYSAIGIAHECRNNLNVIREIFEPACHDIRHWGNKYEIWARMNQILDAVDTFQKSNLPLQKPMVIQPIWRTQGKSPILAENALDIFVWSDFAFSRLFHDASKAKIISGPVNTISRQMRSSARFARILYEISKSGKANIGNILDEMTFDHQTDKEFAVNGRITRQYVDSPRICNPIFKNTILKNIILNGGEKKLSPERRFDATIYYTVSLVSDEISEKEKIIMPDKLTPSAK